VISEAGQRERVAALATFFYVRVFNPLYLLAFFKMAKMANIPTPTPPGHLACSAACHTCRQRLNMT